MGYNKPVSEVKEKWPDGTKSTEPFKNKKGNYKL
ncbi:MAG: hypothetical protein CM1200mP1_13820 [Candidatus Neomarinimicrobiota bacterium]|nr:MAG: hypothetical protein CM1200mP1_13820 [Candidatus Neomarinimicrobiota bacterium]